MTRKWWLKALPFDACCADGDGEKGGEKPGAAAAGGGGGTTEKAYTEAEVNDIVRRRLERDRQTRGRETAVSEEDRQELERLRNEAKDRERQEAERKGEYERIKASWQKEKDEAVALERQHRESAERVVREERVLRSLVESAVRHGAIDPAIVSKLLQDRCRLDKDYRVEVLDEVGKVAYRGAELMTPDQLVEDYLRDKPYLVRAGSTGQGGGSTGGASTTGDGHQMTASAELTKAREEFAAAKAESQQIGSPEAAAKLMAAHRKVKELEAPQRR